MTFVSRMGLKGKYIGKVGSDDLGKFSLQDLRSENIDTSSVLVEEGARNQYGFIIIDRNSGERTILWQRDPKLSFRDAELRREDICAGKVLSSVPFGPVTVTRLPLTSTLTPFGTGIGSLPILDMGLETPTRHSRAPRRQVLFGAPGARSSRPRWCSG